jgi:predicted RNA-binding protein with PIN domain
VTHYLIDGYNWLFRVLHNKQEETLQIEREKIIRELSLKLSTAQMSATLVFDSHYNPGPAERLMARGIPIYFTDAGQTADEYIIEFMKYAARPQDYTIVTSDNRLAWAVRQKQGHSLSIHEFKKMLDRICFKKQNPKPKTEMTISKPITPIKTLQNHYEDIFTKGLEESEASLSPPKKERKKPEIRKEDQELLSDYERWKRIFESKESD